MRRPLLPQLLLLLLVACLINGILLPPASCGAPPPPTSIHFELIRKPPGSRHRARLEHVQEMARNDRLRAAMIAARIGGRRKALEDEDCDVAGVNGTSFAMPMSSAAYTGIGQYFVRFRVGTPAQRFLLLADTGSDLTWMKCRHRACRRCRDPRGREVFLAYRSSSFAPIRCSSQLCKNTLPFSLTRCPTPASPCAYDYGYADGSTAQGIFAKEAATITLSGGQKEKLKGIVVGCTSSSAGSSLRPSDGVLGLGYSQTSFAASAAARFGGKFSYCLVDHLSPKNASDYLVFGDNKVHPPGPGRRHARLILDRRLEPFYAVQVAGVSVGGQLLNISRVVWDSGRGGGTILDSGTSLTVLAAPAYRAVMAALVRSLGGYPRVEMKPFEFCFGWKREAGGFDEAGVPRLVVHLAGARGGLVRLEPPVKSYVIDVADGVKCIGLLRSSWPGVSTIGNILQQNHLWEFDIAHKSLGFQPSSCSPK
uniref:Aspartic proteinase nepenthesin-1 n=1 Tax=Anthurium amnicola TaxID=1678845 RepID=A0A1D1XME7_9ARAE